MAKFDDLFDDDLSDVTEPSSSQQKSKIVGDYLVGRTIGEGSFAKVKLGIHLPTQMKVALKVTPKPLNNCSLEKVRRRMSREVGAMKKFQHPNIAQLMEVLETKHHFYIVLEYIDNGDFMEFIKQKKRLCEDEARVYVHQIASALHHMHQTGVVHRDLKVENLMLDWDMNIKIIDFGLSNTCEYGSSLLSTQCGSPAYAAPEIFDRKRYGAEVDVWSLGVNLYAMLCGTLPFVADSPPKLTKLRAQIYRGCRIPDYLSDSCKDLIEQLLEPDGMKRVKMAEVLAHKWVTEGAATKIYIPELSTSKITPEHLDKPVVQYMLRSYNLNEAQIKEAVLRRKPNSISTTYHLICRRRLKGLGFPESPMSKYLEKWGLVKDERSGSKGIFQPRISIGSSDLLQHHRHRRGTSAATDISKYADGTGNKIDTSIDDICERNLPNIHLIAKLKDKSHHHADPHSLYANCHEDSLSSESFKTSSESSDDKLYSSKNATKSTAAYKDYKEYLKQLRACRSRSSKGILKRNSSEDNGLNTSCYQKLNHPVDIIVPQVITTAETPSPRQNTTGARSQEVDDWERRERSAKSVRFCVDDAHSESGSSNHTRTGSRRACSAKRQLDKFVVRRLSAHTSARRDLSVLARNQNEKATLRADSEISEKAATVTETNDYQQRLEAMNVLWRSQHHQVEDPPPPPPNSAADNLRETSSLRGRLSPPKRDLAPGRHEQKCPVSLSEAKGQSQPVEGHRCKTLNGTSPSVHVNEWEKGMMNASPEKTNSRATTRALPDIPLRKLGTLRSRGVSSAKYAEPKPLIQLYKQPEPEVKASISNGGCDNHQSSTKQPAQTNQIHTPKISKAVDHRASPKLQLRVRLPSANIKDDPVCGTVVLHDSS